MKKIIIILLLILFLFVLPQSAGEIHDAVKKGDTDKVIQFVIVKGAELDLKEIK